MVFLVKCWLCIIYDFNIFLRSVWFRLKEVVIVMNFIWKSFWILCVVIIFCVYCWLCGLYSKRFFVLLCVLGFFFFWCYKWICSKWNVVVEYVLFYFCLMYFWLLFFVGCMCMMFYFELVYYFELVLLFYVLFF